MELETEIVRGLARAGQSLALAESCTGGAIADRITNVPGASEVFWGAFVTYSNGAKQKLLGVQSQTLARHGAVSEAVAREMALGAQRASGADVALAVTGIAGPGGGTPDKPVGTVFIALAWGQHVEVRRLFNPGERLAFKQATGSQALELLHRVILGSR